MPIMMNACVSRNASRFSSFLNMSGIVGLAVRQGNGRIGQKMNSPRRREGREEKVFHHGVHGGHGGSCTSNNIVFFRFKKFIFKNRNCIDGGSHEISVLSVPSVVKTVS